jgi:hypothetical protein
MSGVICLRENIGLAQAPILALSVSQGHGVLRIAYV